MSEIQPQIQTEKNIQEIKSSEKLLKFKLDVELRVMKLMGVNSDETAMEWVNTNMDIFREIFDKEVADGYENLIAEELAQKIKNQLVH